MEAIVNYISLQGYKHLAGLKKISRLPMIVLTWIPTQDASFNAFF